MRDYNIESDLKQEKFEVIKLVQGDKGNKLTINVLEDGKPVSLTGCSITAKYKRADGQVINGSVINISNNSFDAVIDSDITKVVGTLKMLFSIEKDDVKVSTFLLLADVREGLLENTGSSGGSTGGGEVTVDLSNYYKKNETYSKAQIDSQFKDIANDLGKNEDGTDIELPTTDKTVKGAIVELFQDVSNGKISVANAITDKGVNTLATDTFQTMATNIGKISSGINIEGKIITVNNTKYKLSTNSDGDIIATIVKHTVTNNLSNATNNNTALEINDNSSYDANINIGTLGEVGNINLKISSSSNLPVMSIMPNNTNIAIPKANTWLFVVKGYNPKVCNNLCRVKLNDTTNDNNAPNIFYKTSGSTIQIRYGSINVYSSATIPDIIVIGHDSTGYYLWIDGAIVGQGGSGTNAGSLYDIYGLRISDNGVMTYETNKNNIISFLTNLETAVYLNSREDIESILTKDFGYTRT